MGSYPVSKILAGVAALLAFLSFFLAGPFLVLAVLLVAIAVCVS